MSGHSHAHAQASTVPSANGRHWRRLVAALALTASFVMVELVAALTSGSLALLSDAGHLAADVVTLTAAVVAIRLASRPDSSGRRTFGHYRAEVFASGLAVLIMLAVGAFTAVEGINRFGQPQPLATGPMLAVGVIGLVVNLAAIALLRAGAGESLTVRGAYLEVVADTVGSVGVIVAALAVRWTANPVWDTVIALGISTFIIVRALSLGREVIAVLGQHAPSGIDPQRVHADLAQVTGVQDVHDLHVWTLTSGMDVATAHLVLAAGADSDDVLRAATTLLRTQCGITHATLQLESGECDGAPW